jgi:hypothetical protein
MKKGMLVTICCILSLKSFCWGFYAHQLINYLAVFLLPPEMMIFYKPQIQFLADHAVDPDKRRYALDSEGPRHFIDIDLYGPYPYSALPKKYDSAVKKFTEERVIANGIVPWWIQIVQARLTEAFKEKDPVKIIKLSAELGHYIADSHVPLHANSNHDGQFSNQKGIHGFWESRIPELLAEKEFDFMIGKATYIPNIENYTWSRIFESGAEADTVLQTEAILSKQFTADRKFAFEVRNGKLTRQYSPEFTIAYEKLLKGMVERRMRTAIATVASFWYTAWVNAGQPDLKTLQKVTFNHQDMEEFEMLNQAWKKSSPKGRQHE